jgi:glycine/D-amino acid oxidase-like deaminating enzyme
MRKNLSPWLHQLNPERPHTALEADLKTDVAIIGAGIAGIATAFYTLKHTGKSVVMLERFKLAHGATGHNAGQIVSYFERGFASMASEFGLARAAEAQKAIEESWGLLDEMYTEAGLDIPLSRFSGHTGLVSYEQILVHLENNLRRKEAGLQTEEIRIVDDAPFKSDLPAQYAGLYQLVPQSEIQALVESSLADFIASISYQKGVVNSALFCQEVLAYLQEKYAARFTLYEHTPIRKVVLREGHALLDAEHHTLEAARVVLCTNGFESLTIFNETGLDIDAKYHHLVQGRIGYMSGYLEDLEKPPTAISYLTDPNPSSETPYFYLTRRPYEYEKGVRHNLISVGGPEMLLSEAAPYSHEDVYPDEMAARIDEFLRATYASRGSHKVEYIFTWHGLMGYTKNGMRLIGPEPKNPVLLYNLGCNGIGILPSLHGGRTVARHLAGEQVPPSVFDVPTKV